MELRVGIGVPAFAGLLTGILIGLGWRYTVPRASVDANPPPLPPGATSYWIRVNFYEYMGGPSWWPTVLLAVIGMMLGVSAGMGGLAIRRGGELPPLRADVVIMVSGSGIAGGLTGLWGVAIARWERPSIEVVNADGPRPDGYHEGAGFSGVAGAPAYWEISPTWVWFPVVGAIVGVVIALILLLALRANGAIRTFDR